MCLFFYIFILFLVQKLFQGSWRLFCVYVYCVTSLHFRRWRLVGWFKGLFYPKLMVLWVGNGGELMIFFAWRRSGDTKTLSFVMTWQQKDKHNIFRDCMSYEIYSSSYTWDNTEHHPIGTYLERLASKSCSRLPILRYFNAGSKKMHRWGVNSVPLWQFEW